jgi:hypothetical protein
VNPIIFLIPVAALLIVITLYILLLKKVNDKKIFKRFFLTMTVISFILNEAWELLQMPLYEQPIYKIGHIAFCTLGALADTIMVLLLYILFAFIHKNAFWIEQKNWVKIFIVMLTGAVGAVFSEMGHLLIGSWSYDQSMLIIPFVNVGLSPVLQFLLLPVIIYFLSLYIISKFYTHTILHHINHH